MNFPLLHVKWFIENQNTPPSPIYNLTETPFIIWLLIVISLVLIAAFIDKKIQPKPLKWIEKLKTHRPKLVYIFQALVGASLIFASYKNALLVPHYPAEIAPTIFKILQTLAGLILIGNFAQPVAAILILTVYISTIYYFGFSEALDYINLIGIAAFIFLIKRSNKTHNLAVPTLRISTGLALFILALSEKLLYPDKAYEFLEKYHLNFMPTMGLENFGNKLFTLSAGSMEAAFGLILIFGFITRINIAALTIFFLLSNAFFFFTGHPMEGLIELMGHLPVIASVIIFLTYGSGKLSLKKQ